jgi:hypothetical protein
MHHTPRKAIRTQLAEEVGFGCPVEGCGSPNLTWHHFDPPWSERPHHDPAGMVALCRQHHDAADANAYDLDQLRLMKANGRNRNLPLQARFEWRRRRLLSVVGGNFYYETPVPVQIGPQPVVAFRRDGDGRVLLNVAMPSTVPEPRLYVDDNFWIETGAATSVECPPHGRLVAARYPNGDVIRIEFIEIADGDALARRYEHSDRVRSFLEQDEGEGFPIAAVEVRMKIHRPTGEPIIDFDAQATRIAPIQMVGCFVARCGVGLQLGGGTPDSAAA